MIRNAAFFRLAALSCMALALGATPAHAARKARNAPAESMNFYAVSQDAEGLTESGMDDGFLKGLEDYTLEQARAHHAKPPASRRDKKVRKAKEPPAPLINAASSYMDYHGRKLAVVRLTGPGKENQAIIHGLEGKRFYRLGCVARNGAPVFLDNGPCAAKIAEQFGRKKKSR